MYHAQIAREIVIVVVYLPDATAGEDASQIAGKEDVSDKVQSPYFFRSECAV